MKYKVEITHQAEGEAELAFQWISKEAPGSAVRWFNGLVDAIESLETLPGLRPAGQAH